MAQLFFVPFTVFQPNQLTQPVQFDVENERLKKENQRLLIQNSNHLSEIRYLKNKNPLIVVNKRLMSENKDLFCLLDKYRLLLSKIQNLCVCQQRTDLNDLIQEVEKQYQTVTANHKKELCFRLKQTPNNNQWTNFTYTPENGVQIIANTFKCDECVAEFPEEHLRVQHKLEEHSKQTHFECKDCHKMLAEKQVCDCSNVSNEVVVSSNEELKPTDNQSTSALKFVCNVCGKRWSLISELVNHQRNTHKIENPYKCSECETRFRYYKQLERHKMEIHPRLERYECPKCCKKFSSQRSLYNHNYTLHRVRLASYQHKCKLCSFQTNRPESLKRHSIRLHLGNKKPLRKYVCDVEGCGKTLFTKYNLKKHIINIHTVRENSIECDFEGCHKMFKDMNAMKNHKMYYHSDKSFVCDWPGCDWAFKTNAQCENHKYVHLSEKAFKCTFDGCSKTFKHKTTRNNHYRTHLKKYICDWPECDQRFADKQALLAHINRHKNLRPFKCYIDDCQKDFYNKKQLDQHIRSFHNSKPIPTK